MSFRARRARNLLFLFLFSLVFPSYAQLSDLCALKEKDLKNEEIWGAEIRKAISASTQFVELSLVSFSEVSEGEVNEAASVALQAAFRRIVEKATRELVPPSRFSSVMARAEKRIFERPRGFILNFRKLKSTVCDDREYRVMIKATLKLRELEKALVDEGIIEVEFLTKKIVISNVYHVDDYFSIREFLRRRIPHLKRLVESYQKHGEIEFLIETPAGWDDIRARLSSVESADVPKFQLVYDEKKGLELIVP